MTRKQALQKALQALDDREAAEKIEEILEDMPVTCWSECTIFDTIDQFVIDNGRVPTTTDFKRKGMPPHSVIKLRFGVTLKEFLQSNYPPTDRLCASRGYHYKKENEWKEIFIGEYIRNKPTSAEEYNSARGENMPSWGTVAKLFGVSRWLEWLEYCGLERNCGRGTKPKGKRRLTVSSRNDLEEHIRE